jgi:hypothetical protein
MGNNYNYVTKNYPNAPNIAQITRDDLNNWLEDTKLPLAIKNNPNANYVKCLGNEKCNGKCSLGKHCIKQYSLENILVSNFDVTKCNKKQKIQNDEIIVYHNKCQASMDYSKFLASIIIKTCKKDNPNEQSLWNVDSTRYSYIIKIIKDKISQWTHDKTGAKTKKHVIEPLIANIRGLLEDYMGALVQSYLNIVKKYIIFTKGKRQCNRKNKITYDFDQLGDVDNIYSMHSGINIDKKLADIISSCNDYNNSNCYEYKVDEYNLASQTLIDMFIKTHKVIEHIKDKPFSSAIIRDIAPEFYLNKKNPTVVEVE